jgi:hypothetical protein
MKTRTPSELLERIREVDSRMVHQPARRGWMDAPAIDTSCCTSPKCSCTRKARPR